jgi:hypothetical protein
MALHKPEHKKVWWWLAWPFMFLGFVVVFPFAYPFVGRKRDGKNTWLKNWEDYIDDPIDWMKEKLHCARLPFGYQLNISFIMLNRETTWDIIRRDGKYGNCDPDD